MDHCDESVKLEPVHQLICLPVYCVLDHRAVASSIVLTLCAHSPVYFAFSSFHIFLIFLIFTQINPEICSFRWVSLVESLCTCSGNLQSVSEFSKMLQNAQQNSQPNSRTFRSCGVWFRMWRAFLLESLQWRAHRMLLKHYFNRDAMPTVPYSQLYAHHHLAVSPPSASSLQNLAMPFIPNRPVYRILAECIRCVPLNGQKQKSEIYHRDRSSKWPAKRIVETRRCTMHCGRFRWKGIEETEDQWVEELA